MSGFIGALIFFLVLQTVTAGGRLYVRTAIVKKFGADDVAVIFTYLLSTAYSACVIAVFYATRQAPLTKIPLNVLFPAVGTILASELCYIAGAACLKIALGLLLLRVLVRRWQIYTIYATIAVAVIFGICFFLVILFQCGSPGDFVIRFFRNSCLRPEVVSGMSYTHAIVNAVADWIFAVLPIFFLLRTNLDLRAKISVGAILALGSVGSICTVVRIAYVRFLSVPTPDFLVTSEGIAIMSAAELSIGIACASISTYRPLFTRFFATNNTVSDSENQHLSRLEMRPQEMGRDKYSGSVTPPPGASDSDEEDWHKSSGFVSGCTSPTSERKFVV